MSSFPAPNRICRCGAHFYQKKKKKGKGRLQCSSCRKGLKYRSYKGDSCESCGFVAVLVGQLDVDHIDGDHTNNDISNLQTLCANCHRLKTHLCKDHLSEGTDEPEIHIIQIELKL